MFLTINTTSTICREAHFLTFWPSNFYLPKVTVLWPCRSPLTSSLSCIPVMASLRLTIRLKTSDESEAWRMAAESQGYSTLNKFIRTVVNKSILDLNANRDEVEQRNRQRMGVRSVANFATDFACLRGHVWGFSLGLMKIRPNVNNNKANYLSIH